MALKSYGPGIYTAEIPLGATVDFIFAGAGGTVGGGGGGVLEVAVTGVGAGITLGTAVTIVVGKAGINGSAGASSILTAYIVLANRTSLTAVATAGGGQAGSGSLAAGGANTFVNANGFVFTVDITGAANGMNIDLSQLTPAFPSQPGGTPASVGGGGGVGGPGSSAGQLVATAAGAGGVGGPDATSGSIASQGGDGILYTRALLRKVSSASFPLVVSIAVPLPTNNLVFVSSGSPMVPFNAGDLIEFVLVGGGGNGGSDNPGDFLQFPGTGGGGGAVAFVNLGVAPLSGYIIFTAGPGGNGFSAPNIGVAGSPSTAAVTFIESGFPVQTTYYAAGGGNGGNLYSAPPLVAAQASYTTNGETRFLASFSTVNNQALNVPAADNIFNLQVTNAPPQVNSPTYAASAGGAGYSTTVNGVMMDFGTGGYGVGYAVGNYGATAGADGVVNYVISSPSS